MSEEEIEAGEKPFEPTQKKLEDARKKGEIASSNDLTAAAAYGGLLLAGITAGGQSLNQMAMSLANMLDRAPEYSEQVFGGYGSTLVGGVMRSTLGPVSTWLGVPMILAIVALTFQRAFVFAPEKLKPKLSRISPLSNGKQKFGRSGLFEFAKSFVKLMVYSLTLGGFIWLNLPDLLVTISMSPPAIVVKLIELSVGFFAIVLLIALGIGGIDFLWQRSEHIRKNRMSHKEIADETKESEGDPWLKNERRQRGYDIATNRMLEDVRSSDVVLVNPTHYAVALRWDRKQGGAPICVAKGADEIAARIRDRAVESGVPIRRDPPTVRALYQTIDVGQEILPEHYRPVAAAIRFAETMRQKAKGFTE